MSDKTEAEAIAALAVQPKSYEVGDRVMLFNAPSDWRQATVDWERLGSAPRRPRGTIVVHDADSIIAAVERRRSGGSEPVIYADEERRTLVAIINDDEADVAAFRDYAVSLALRPTPEWTFWKGKDGHQLSQQNFAEHIEDGVLELRDPEPTIMLDIAQTFHANANAVFKSGSRLQSGAVQFRYEEDIDASAGSGGSLIIPETLTLVVAPFFGSARYEVTARFRYRLARDKFTLGYKLNRPNEVERVAFNEIRAKVVAALPNCGHIAGPAPEPTLPI